MKKPVRIVLKMLLYTLTLIVLYVVSALILTYLPANSKAAICDGKDTIFLHTNGVHLDVIIPVDQMSDELRSALRHEHEYRYASFGWGDEQFYLHTPTWADLKFSTAVNALFLKSHSLMHVTRFRNPQDKWKRVALCPDQLERMNQYILASFALDTDNGDAVEVGAGYTPNDAFYKAIGSYTLFNTCNSWVNTAFKTSGLKACSWTPFDFGLFGMY